MQQVFSLAWHKLPSQRQQLQAFDCSLCFAHFPWRVSKRRTPAYFAARTCFAFEFVSPYLLGKPNLDDTCRLSHNCKPSLAACVSPISPGASVKGELLPTLAARTCFTFEFVSPYLLCKPNLDDTHEISARTVHKKVI